LIDRLRIDRTLRVLCGWRYQRDIPSESKFSRVFKELSDLKIAEKTHEKFVEKYLSDKLFFYNATDATKVELREKPVKVEKKKSKPKKRGRPKKGEAREPIKPTILKQQKEMKSVEEMLECVSTACGVGVKQFKNIRVRTAEPPLEFFNRCGYNRSEEKNTPIASTIRDKIMGCINRIK
jgi:hypothetical protein